MKSIWLIFFLGWFSSCAGRQEKVHLCQEWKYDLAATRQEMAIREASFAETSYMESIMAGLQFARIRFFDNGQLEFQLDSLRQEGKWRFRRAGKELTLRITDREQIHQIVRLGPDTLILQPLAEEGLPFPRVLVRDTLQ
ncbi:MAG: hypothetical protein IPI11_09440 [Haliscomenobacter sp.]|nr:hypothetical protein [Haliscomenobacter sp.]